MMITRAIGSTILIIAVGAVAGWGWGGWLTIRRWQSIRRRFSRRTRQQRALDAANRD